MKLEDKSFEKEVPSWLRHLHERLVAAVEMERYVSANELLNTVHNPSLAKAYKSVSVRLLEISKQLVGSARSDSREVRHALKTGLIKEVNKISLLSIQMASTAFECLQRSPVSYFFNVSNDVDNPCWEEFDFDQFPFIKGHGEVLGAALEIRKEDPKQQLLSLRYLLCKEELVPIEDAMRSLKDRIDHADGYAALQKEYAANQTLLVSLEAKIKESMRSAAEKFYGCIARGTIHPYAIPIGIKSNATGDDLRVVGNAYRNFGPALSIPSPLKIEAERLAKTETLRAWANYDEAGHTFTALSAWVTALGLIESPRLCMICYRHAVAICRCADHATKKQETREGRLGKLIEPGYRKRLEFSIRSQDFRTLSKPRLSWSRVAPSTEFATELSLIELGEASASRATVLANQLREIYPLLNHDMAANMAQLFKSVVKTARQIELLPAPSVGHEQRRRRQLEAALEILSLKGFLRAWCADGAYSMDVPMQMLGFDRASGFAKKLAFDRFAMIHLLLSQRAWEDEEKVFMAKLVTANDISSALRDGFDMKKIAAQYRIALSTAYKILKRGATPRKRNYFAQHE